MYLIFQYININAWGSKVTGRFPGAQPLTTLGEPVPENDRQNAFMPGDTLAQSHLQCVATAMRRRWDSHH